MAGVNELLYHFRFGFFYRALLIMLFCSSAHLLAQPGKLSLIGTIEETGGQTYKYRMTLEITGNNVKGVSVTTQDGTEFSTRVKGMINREKKILLITETASIGKLADSFEMCFLNSVLTWKTKKGKYIISGAFVGQNKRKEPCSQGTAHFELPLADGAVLKKEEPVPAATPDENAAVADTNKITEGIDKRIEWHSPECVLELWDGGVVDGDIVTVMVNGKEVLASYTLTEDKKALTIPLITGMNTITVVAGEEGSAPPNTAQMLLKDGDQYHKVTAYNKKGKSANIVINRK
jgi:hypothetical protein